jgi:hypothetical protein
MVAPEVLVALIGTIGTLAGVIAGAGLGWRTQSTAWQRDKAERFRSERLTLYSQFLAAVRDWRAVVLSDAVTIVGASRVSRDAHADGGDSAILAIGREAEIGLVAESAAIIEAARSLVRSVRFIAEARATHVDSLVPTEIVQASRHSENWFIMVARRDLGTAARDNLAHLFPTEDRVAL